MINENIIKLKDENNKLKEVEVLFTFQSSDNNKSYLVYTDHSKDSDDKEKVFAGIFDETLEDDTLYPIESNEDWLIIEHILSSIEKKENIG